jgi:DNA-directed RNA polymerase specialized sigma24 family protein
MAAFATTPSALLVERAASVAVPGGHGTFSAGARSESVNHHSVSSSLKVRSFSFEGVSLAMSISQQIAPHLPYLRRFARALCGRQKSGDAYVAAVLETLIADPASFSSELHPRIALYRLFLKIWGSLDLNANGVRQPSGPETAATRSLEAITPLPRQAFLLASVEGFTPAEVAQILDTDARTATQLIDQASREIADHITTDVLIIEDEPLIAMDLTSVAEGLGHRVVGRARTHGEAIKAAQRKPPGLVLADIQLADGSSGLEAVNEIVQSMSVPVIFITAYPERLLTGERPEPTFLITKPFQTDTVRAIISQALFFDVRADPRGRQQVLA